MSLSANSRLTRKQEVIGSSVELVTRNALVATNGPTIRGFSKMTLSSLQAEAPRVILSGFSLSNCTEKTRESRFARFAN